MKIWRVVSGKNLKKDFFSIFVILFLIDSNILENILYSPKITIF